MERLPRVNNIAYLFTLFAYVTVYGSQNNAPGIRGLTSEKWVG